MPDAIVALCQLEFYLPGVSSLKEKRSIVKSMLARVHNKFNVAASEVTHMDTWQSSGIAIVTVSNSSRHAEQMLQQVIRWLEEHYPDALLTKQHIEVF